LGELRKTTPTPSVLAILSRSLVASSVGLMPTRIGPGIGVASLEEIDALF
jgi:hypothetical protein